ncbi:MAG TPA: ribonuclease P protein component [Acidimicrobiia bacterium]|nr:ribonuclease P protein component [Acidimicrobiia bacterium]
MIWRVRDRDAFAALAQGRRLRSGCLAVTRVPTGEGPPRVAYAVGRRVGGAVVRNRVRRRLRAATNAARPALVAGSAYLVSAGPGSAQMPFDEVRSTLSQLFERSRSER